MKIQTDGQGDSYIPLPLFARDEKRKQKMVQYLAVNRA